MELKPVAKTARLVGVTVAVGGPRRDGFRFLRRAIGCRTCNRRRRGSSPAFGPTEITDGYSMSGFTREQRRLETGRHFSAAESASRSRGPVGGSSRSQEWKGERHDEAGAEQREFGIHWLFPVPERGDGREKDVVREVPSGLRLSFKVPATSP